MTGGTITKHYSGILNCNNDALSHEEFAPVAELSGGEISGNLRGAIINQIRGTVIITGDVNISGKIPMSDKMRSLAADNKQTAVVSNENALLKIQGGTVTAAASGETAILNDEKGIVEMTAGDIIASGEQSYALQNANRTVGDVKVTGGNILATSESSHAIDNQGYMEISEDVVVSSKEEKQVLISVSYNDGGTVTPGTGMVETNQTLEFFITPDSGYKIESVEFDGVNQPIQPNPYKLEVDEKNHFVRVNFIEVSSNSHGSSSSGGGSSRSVKSASRPEFPETPGMWKQTEKGWQYLDVDGIAYVKTWIFKDGKWYWIAENGIMAEGWELVNNCWYYLTPISGDMKTGWFFDGMSWYYLGESGARKTGWVQVSGNWYFMDGEGKMASDTTTPDGYKVDAAGAWVQ